MPLAFAGLASDLRKMFRTLKYGENENYTQTLKQLVEGCKCTGHDNDSFIQSSYSCCDHLSDIALTYHFSAGTDLSDALLKYAYQRPDLVAFDVNSFGFDFSTFDLQINEDSNMHKINAFDATYELKRRFDAVSDYWQLRRFHRDSYYNMSPDAQRAISDTSVFKPSGFIRRNQYHPSVGELSLQEIESSKGAYIQGPLAFYIFI